MDNIELIFFDTFSHDIAGELNLDLVQFIKPVYISEIRIIPLGARVQADFPGGVRLGATNPSQFEIEFFVNNYSKPGSPTFESLGGLEYKQNVNIQLECEKKQILTDGLILKGWYTTITLAVYGSLNKTITIPPEVPPPAPPVAEVPAEIPEPEPKPSTSQTVEQQPDWYFENHSQAPATFTAPEPPATSPTPAAQPAPVTVESPVKTLVNEPDKSEPKQWTEETPEETPKPIKRPSSPPAESLVSLSPESISAEEEEAEREAEEMVTEAIEPFEPILSDEELMTDDLPPTAAEFTCDIPEDIHMIEPPDLLNIEKLPEGLKKDNADNSEKIREIIRSVAKSVINFNNVTGQEKEVFVHNCETLCVLLGSSFHPDNDDLQDITEIVNAGLDMELARAQPQPAYKVRHVKVGVRLAEAASALEEGADILLKVQAPHKLLTLCTRENVALPVKLAALRALDAALISPKIVEEFLKSDNNLYKLTLLMLDEAKLARLKYALVSLLRKIHVYELLSEINQVGLKEITLVELTQAYVCAPTLMAQPKRQLPARMQMEFEREHNRNPRKHLISYFHHYGLIRRIFFALVSPDSTESLIKATRKFLSHLADTGDGLWYLFKESEVTRSILKAIRYEKPGLGAVIAWRLQVVQCLALLKNPSTQDWLVIKKLHSFLTFPEGLRAIIKVLSIDSFIDILIPLLSNRDLSEFAAELITTMVRYSDEVEVLQSRAGALIEEARSQVILRDVMSHLTVAALATNWNHGDVSSLVTTIRKYADKAPSLPGELITACRILHHLIFPSSSDMDPMEAYIELKHRNALTQLFAADGLTALIAVMNKLTNFYQQPYVYRAAFTGRRGILLISILLPCVKLTHALLERLVKCMATEFKDLTPVVPLLGVYALVDAIPNSSQSTRLLADEVAETLLLFTRAVDSDGAGNVAKSLWTQMLGEVLKMISSSPCNFIPGLKLFSRLLPPILYLEDTAENEDTLRALGLRKLWSAHLQAQAVNLAETLRLLCASWNETLLTLLSTVCKQLSDLAAPTALLVGRCLLDRILAASPLENHRPTLVLLSDLALHAPVKATLLTLLSPTSRAQVKSDQKYIPVVDMMCSALKNTTDKNVQIEILDIFKTLCDHTLSIMQEEHIESFEIRLTHSVPSKEPLLSIITALIDILANATKYSSDVLENTLRILLSLTHHNYGLYHVKSCLENNLGTLKSFLEHVATVENAEDEDKKVNPTLTVTFLESLITCGKFERRSLYLRLSQLATLIMWDKNETHPLEKISGTAELVNDLKAAVENKDEKEPIPEMLEPLLPTPDALLNQFSQRSIKRSRSPIPRARKRFSGTGSLENNNTVDLIALATELLPADFNLITATQMLCSKTLSKDILESGQTKEENSRDTRELQKPPTVPTAKTKMPFVSPMRGRAQFVSSRGGLTSGGVGRGADPFRSRPPNTSRPPSLHVDDFVALETCGAQPTGPTGYNKLSVRGTCPPRGVITGPRCRPWMEPRPPYMR
ncbi:protein virilizer [Microplitis mediator]|uniref:protein virilizer n=1 Tax=Microplitis mediator TaxID=375433 RepID=UPI002552BF17|nr:protein virilizer [Microplitis mediator]